MRDEYTLSTIYGENCGQRVAAMQVEGGGWLVAPKIARINIRARHCHSVNFPRCWLCTASERRTGTVLLVAAKQRGGGEEGRREKHRYPFPSPPFSRWNFMRSAFSTQRAHVVRPHFRCTLPSGSPLRVTSTIHDRPTPRDAYVCLARECTRVWEWNWWREKKKKKWEKGKK